MTRLLVIWIALAIGCRDPALSRLDEVKATVCTCKDALCAEEAMKVVPGMNIKPNARSQKIAREMLDCLAKLNAADRPATGPDEPTTPPAPATPGTATAVPGTAPATAPAPAPAKPAPARPAR